MSDEATVSHMVHFVLRNVQETMQRGSLAIWTVYDRPTDAPASIIARMHEAGPGGKHVATDRTLEVPGDQLELLREVFSRAGLHCIQRDVGDEKQIVESWV